MDEFLSPSVTGGLACNHANSDRCLEGHMFLLQMWCWKWEVYLIFQGCPVEPRFPEIIPGWQENYGLGPAWHENRKDASKTEAANFRLGTEKSCLRQLIKGQVVCLM